MKIRKTSFYVVVVLLISSIFISSCSPKQNDRELEINGLFSNHMVIQRDNKLNIKGWATPNKIVKIETSWNENASVLTNEDGTWRATIPTPPAGGPYEINVSSNDKTITIKDVLSGEVWVASGQSNMEFPIKGWRDTINNADFEIKNANYPEIRMLTVPKTVSFAKKDNVKAEWIVTSPKTVSKFSAAAYFFARKLHSKLNVPIGIISSSWGGTPVEPWIPVESLENIKEFEQTAKDLKKAEKQYPEFLKWTKVTEYVNIKDLKKEGIGYNIEIKNKEFTELSFSDKSWGKIDPSKYWEEQEVGGFDGMVWYRNEFVINNLDSLKGANLYLGPINDMDITFINGKKINSSLGVGLYNKPRNYKIPKGVLKIGKNVIAIRVLDFAGEGGIYRVNNKDITISQSEKEIVTLSEGWKYKAVATILSSNDVYWINDKNPMPPLSMAYGPHTPTLLFNSMIYPLTSYTIKGVIWYQGESNVGRADEYKTLFTEMIKGWRKSWNEGDFPFYFVQIAPFDYKNGVATSELRDAQKFALKLPNTGMAVTMDIASLKTIHPGNKQDVGTRLALWALKNTYKTYIEECSGPLVKSISKKGNKIVIYYTHTTKGLVMKNNSRTFEIAGEDGVFIDAEIRIIDNNKMELWSKKIKNPKSVRYLWTDFKKANLYNGFGLPASPFIEHLK